MVKTELYKSSMNDKDNQLSSNLQPFSTNHRQRIPVNERGMAIVIVMGVIMLVFMLGMLFTTKSMIDRKSTENYDSLQVARMTARSALHRAIARIDIFGEDIASVYDVNNKNKIIASHVEGTTITGVDSSLYMTEGLNSDTDKYDDLAAANIQWQYLPDNHSTDTPIQARIAYFVEPELNFGKVNLNACIDTGYAKKKHGKTIKSENEPRRGGKDLEELSLKSILLPDFTKKVASKYNNGLLPEPKTNSAGKIISSKWRSAKMLQKFTEISDIDRNNLSKIFTFSSQPSPEAFLMTNATGKDTSRYHRFNLARTDWDDRVRVEDLTEMDSIRYTDNEYSSKMMRVKIPWLANWQEKGDMLTGSQAKKQIAANLIDYSDVNSFPTSDYKKTNIEEKLPSYVGVESCPMINEVEIDIEFIMHNKKNDRWVEVTSITPKIEVIDMYNEPGDGNPFFVKADVDFEFSFDVELSGIDIDYSLQNGRSDETYDAKRTIQSGLLKFASGKTPLSNTVKYKVINDFDFSNTELLKNQFEKPIKLINKPGNVYPQKAWDFEQILVNSNVRVISFKISNLIIKDLRVKLTGTNVPDDSSDFNKYKLLDYSYILLNENLLKNSSDFANISLGDLADSSGRINSNEEAGYSRPKLDGDGKPVHEYEIELKPEHEVVPKEFELEAYVTSTGRIRRDINGNPILKLDSSGNTIFKLDSSGNKIPKKDENGDVIPILENGEPKLKLVDGQPVPRKDDEGNIIPKRDANGNIIPERDADGELIHRKYAIGDVIPEGYEIGDDIPKFDQNGDPIPVYEITPNVMDALYTEISYRELSKQPEKLDNDNKVIPAKAIAYVPGKNPQTADITEGTISINFKVADPRQNMWPNSWRVKPDGINVDKTEYTYPASNVEKPGFDRVGYKVAFPNNTKSAVYDNDSGVLYLNDPFYYHPTFGTNTNGNNFPGAKNDYIDETKQEDHYTHVNSENTDKEVQNKDPWLISTAKIANKPMETLAELGLIHRARRGQTINLRKFDKDKGIKGDAGGGDYTKGDANILNQVKLSSGTKNYKINLNTPYKEILTMLFDGIEYDFKIKNYKREYIVENSKAEVIADKILEVTHADTGLITAINEGKIKHIIENKENYSKNFLTTRAEILSDKYNPVNKYIRTNLIDEVLDAEEEAVIGKSINLTEAKGYTGFNVSDEFNIIAISQTINDMGGGITVFHDINQDGDVKDANEKITNVQYGNYDQYADQIIGTQKIHAKVYRDPSTGLVKINSFRYLGK
ncbi:MAG: hypothetical protein GY756_05005 [bacterium]|nr:hypothetical protein [bacterium]